MADDKKNLFIQILVPVVITLLVGGTAPWWWGVLTGKNLQDKHAAGDVRGVNNNTPPAIAAPILQKEDLFSMEYGPDTGCYPEGHIYTVTVVKPGQDEISLSENSVFFLRDDRGIDEKYIIEPPNNYAASWLPAIMVPGRRLEIKYAQCGNAGLRFLTHIHVLPNR